VASFPNILLFHEGGQYGPSDAEEFVPYEPRLSGRYSDDAGLSDRPIQAATYIDVKRSADVLSFGNLRLLPDNVTAYTGYTTAGVSLRMDPTSFGLAITIVASFATAVCLAGVMWLWRTDAASNQRDSWNPFGTVTIEEYSVTITNLPKFVTKEELKGHLELVGWFFPSPVSIWCLERRVVPPGHQGTYSRDCVG
jgi:hypothetical protein